MNEAELGFELKMALERIEALEAALNDIIIRAEDYDEAAAIARAALTGGGA